MLLRRKAVSGKQLIAKFDTDEYELSYLILKHDLTVLDPPNNFLLKAFLKPRYLKADSEEFLEIIRNDPSSLRQKLFLQSEVEKIPKRESVPSHPTRKLGRYCRSGGTSRPRTLPKGFKKPLGTTEEEDSKPSRPVKGSALYSLPENGHQARPIPNVLDKILGITEDSLLKGAIEEHESEIKKSPNVFSLIGKVWFVKFEQEEWGLYPDQEKYKYIANLLSLSNGDPKNDNLEYSIYNFDLMAEVKGKEIREEYPSDKLEDWNVSDFSEELTSEELKNFRQTGNELIETLKEVKESNDQNRIDEAQHTFDKYRSYLFNEYGIKTLISKDEREVFLRPLQRSSSDNEKVRQRVKNQINNAIKDFKNHMPMFGRHLRHSVKTKLYETLYSPENHIAWHISM